MKPLSITAIAFVGAVSQITTSEAFTTSATHSTITHPSSSTQLYSVEDMRQRIKKAGGGITTIVPGDLTLYDPNENGKLQGTGDLEARVSAGTSFPGDTSSSTPESSVVTPAVETPTNKASGATKPSIKAMTSNLTNLLSSGRPRRDSYTGKSQC